MLCVRTLAAAFLFAIVTAWSGEAAPGPELWYFHHSELDSDNALRASEALIDRAAAAGYTGVVLWCGGIDLAGDPDWPVENEDRMRTALKYAASKHLKTVVTAAPFANSVNPLRVNSNWAEAQRITGAEFQVDPGGKNLRLVNSFPGLKNANFESGKTGWFDTNDQGAAIDTEVAHSGHSSAVIDSAKGNSRLRQKIELKPWRQYHLRLFYKSRGFGGFSQVEVLEAGDKVRFNSAVHARGDADWVQADYSFDSQDTTDAYLYLGVWGGSTGKLWFDDLQLEETALVYVTRRQGTPLKVYDAQNLGTVYREGQDFHQITDPRMAERHPFTDTYHEPPTVTLPRGTHLAAGQKVAMDFYSVFPIPGSNQVTMCLTDQGVAKWVRQNAHAIRKLLPPGSGVLLEYDEMRQMYSCASCRAAKSSAGQLLAASLMQTVDTFKAAIPDAPLYVWNDMFDPYHNAVKNYFYVEGDLAGSWKGLPREITIMNWNLDKLQKSLGWFAGLEHEQPVAYKQIIAGYYDTGDGAGAARQELQQAAGVPGVSGLMYTTWNDDYSQLENFAKAAKENWGSYAASPKRSASRLPGGSWPLPSAVAVLGTSLIWFRSRRRAN